MAGLYIHIPFCLSKCDYCAFVSYPSVGRDIPAYLESLKQQIELAARLPWAAERRFSSIYFGGGTPTILPADQLNELLQRIRESFTIIPSPEISLEANPDTLNLAKLEELRQGGFNRLSIGVQSLNDRLLKTLNRTHTASQARDAVCLARRAGFNNINLDLIFGLPGQNLDIWLENLSEAIVLEPDHLAAYQLSIDQGSRFARQAADGRLSLPDEETEASMLEAAVSLLPQAGYERYEISNFARPDRFCRHNLAYWQNLSYLGLGAGAFSCLSGLRLQITPDPGRFTRLLAKGIPPFIEAEALDRERHFRETVVMGLRLISGLDLAAIRQRFNLDPRKYYGEILERLLEKKLMIINNNHLRLHPATLPVANQILAQLV